VGDKGQNRVGSEARDEEHPIGEEIRKRVRGPSTKGEGERRLERVLSHKNESQVSKMNFKREKRVAATEKRMLKKYLAPEKKTQSG